MSIRMCVTCKPALSDPPDPADLPDLPDLP